MSTGLKMTHLKSCQNSAEEHIMGTKNTEWKFLLTTAFLVATIAVPTLASLISSEAPVTPEILVLKPQLQKTREPASLPHLKGPDKAVVIQDANKELNNLISENSINFDFRCAKDAALEFKVQGSYVQLKGRDCGKNTSAPKLSVTNKTNGFTASVFFTDGKQYQTDLIQLKEGENQIQIQYETSSGKSEQRILNVKSGAI
jgi:hypothetical protein